MFLTIYLVCMCIYIYKYACIKNTYGMDIKKNLSKILSLFSNIHFHKNSFAEQNFKIIPEIFIFYQICFQ